MSSIWKQLGKRPVIVASIGAESSILSTAKKAAKDGADMIELRIDSVPPAERKNIPPLIKKMKRAAKLPILATVRSPKEQEKRADLYRVSDSERAKIFEMILKDVDCIDLEFSSEKLAKNLILKAHGLGKKVVLSYHNFKHMPTKVKIQLLTKKFKRLSGDILKIAGMPKSFEETKKFLEICSSLKGMHRVFVGMGKFGLLSRTCGFSYGSCWTYGYVKKSMAPGQLSIQELVHLLK